MAVRDLHSRPEASTGLNAVPPRLMMFAPRRLAVIALVAVTYATAAHAQLPQPPTADQARRLLETRPELVAQLRREIANSGLTPDQIRARLRTAGYPEDLLDAYLASRPV